MSTKMLKKDPRQKAKRYTRAYKDEVIRMCKEPGKSSYSVSKELGLTYSMVRAWVVGSENMVDGVLSRDERAELLVLRREVKALRQDREILRKATVYFAKGTSS